MVNNKKDGVREHNIETIHRSCPLCGDVEQPKTLWKYVREPWMIKQCSKCQFVYLQNGPAYAELVESHAWTRSFQAEREYRRVREPIFSAVSRWYKRFRLKFLWVEKAPKYIDRFVTGQRLLDVGCGRGSLLRKLPSRFTPFGIEIEAQAAAAAHAFASGRGGRVLHQDALSGMRGFEDGQLDGILMHSYLEHENQPARIMAEAYRLLRPGGRLIVKVPNFACLNRRIRGARWCGFRFPDHVNYFTPKTLAAMTRQANLQIVRFGFWDKQPTSDNMWMVAQRPRVSLPTKNAA